MVTWTLRDPARQWWVGETGNPGALRFTLHVRNQADGSFVLSLTIAGVTLLGDRRAGDMNVEAAKKLCELWLVRVLREALEEAKPAITQPLES